VADNMGGHALGNRDELVVDDEDAVVATADVALDNNGAGPALFLGDRIELANFVLVFEIDADAAAVVAIERFDHDRESDALRLAHRLVDIPYHDAAGHRDPDLVEKTVRQLLVRRDVDGDVRGGGGDGRPDAPLVDAATELDQRTARIEAKHGDTA